MYESDDYRWGRQQAENGVARDPWSGRMSREEIRGYHDEMDRQRRQREEQEAAWASPVAEGGGGYGGGWLGVGVLGFFAVAIAVQFVIEYRKPLLLGMVTVASVVALAWAVAQIPAATWQHWGRNAWHAPRRVWQVGVAGGRTTWRHLGRLRRLALARARGRSLPAIERIGRRWP
jgi:hypothetical protein